MAKRTRPSSLGRGTSAYTEGDLGVRTTLTLPHALNEYLRGVSTRCRREGGRHMDRTQIVRSLVRALRDLERQVDWAGIGDEDELARRLTAGFRR